MKEVRYNDEQQAIRHKSTVSEIVSGAFVASKPKDIAALYSRLSNEDALDGQSGFISNQMEILETYAKSQSFTNIVHFCDDDDTGVPLGKRCTFW